MEINGFANNIYYENGIWFSKSNREISYPQEGNSDCYEIEKDSFWFRHRNNCILEAVKHYSMNDVFFDIGGGNGYVAKGLIDNHIQAVLIEPGIEGALNAKARGVKNIICSSFEDAGIKSNSCKAIGLFDVVEHVKNDRLFIKSINSILTDYGILYLTVPAFRTLWSNDDIKAGHFRRYTISQIRKILKDEGFSIVYSTYIFSILPFPIFIFRTIPSFFRLNIKSKKITDYKVEHSQEKGYFTFILNKIWAKELDFIKKKKVIPFGASCFIVARKSGVKSA